MNAITDQSVADCIDAACKDKGITTTRFAELMECSRKKARRLRSGRRKRVLISEVIIASRVLGVPLEDFFKEVD